MTTRTVTAADVEAVRQKFLAGDYAGVLASDRRLREDGGWAAEPGASRAALNERLNYFATRSRDALGT